MQDFTSLVDVIERFSISDAVLVGAVLLVVGLFYVFKRTLWIRLQKRHDNFFIILFRNFNAPVQTLFLISACYVVLRNLPLNLGESGFIDNFYTTAFIGGVSWLLLRAVSTASDLFLKRFDIEVRDNLFARGMHTKVKVIRRIVSSVIILIATAVALMTFEQIHSLGVSLLASAGVAGVVLGLAAQKTLGNFFTGLQIAITQPIRLGDAVVVEGEWGWIEEINLTYVVVKIWDLRRLVLPISYFVERPFQNWTRTSADILGTVEIYTDYTMPLAPLRAELTRILENEGKALWDGKVNVIQITEAGEKTVLLRALVSAADSPAAWDLRCLVREKLVAFIQSEYPQHLPLFRADSPMAGREGVAA